MKKIIPILAFLLIAIIQTSCNNEDHVSNPGETGKTGSEWKGLGESKETPEGIAYNLPAGVELINDPIKGYDEGECDCQWSDSDCHKGSGSGVRICLGFRNTNNTPITVTLPAGLIFISIETETQNGLLIQLETFEVPPGESQFELALHCTNKSRSAGGTEDLFTMGPVIQNKEIRELIDLVKNKDLRDNYTIPAPGVGPEGLSPTVILDECVWDITDRNGVTEARRALLNNLRNR